MNAVKEPGLALIHPGFESLVQSIIQVVGKEKLTELRRDFHTRLRITLNQPQDSEWVEDLWDFFYDWCVFEQKLPESLKEKSPGDYSLWSQVHDGSNRGLYSISRIGTKDLKLKELYSGKAFVVARRNPNDFLGFEKGDLLEGRLVGGKEEGFSFLRRPSFHPLEVHAYIKKKVKQFKKQQDFNTYQNWLWLLVGMYLKHRIYTHMPIDKIYDDNSRI